MVLNEEVIKKEIKEHMDRSPFPYGDWYAGVASDPEKRLFNEHKVQKYGGHWIYRECISDFVSRRVENYLINSLGTDGGPGGGDKDSVFVYAYHKTNGTQEMR